MGDRGLDTSIWASRSNGYGDSFTKPGDWKCPSCGFSNFQRRSECMKCSTSRASTPRSSSPAVIAPPQIVPLQSGNNNSSFGVTSSPAAPIAQTQSPALPEQGKGLADSYWAPRNHNGRVTQTHKPQVWIKVCYKCVPNSKPHLIQRLTEAHSRLLHHEQRSTRK